MNFNNPNTKNSTIVLRAVCAIVFILFSFIYLYFYQGDVLAVAQHVLSGGATSYNRLIGAVLITAALVLLQVGVRFVTSIRKSFSVVNWFPSMLALAVLTDVSPDIGRASDFSLWLWLAPLLLLLWGGVAFVAKRLEQIDFGSQAAGLRSTALWISMLVMSFFMLFVGSIGIGNDVFHYRVAAEGRMLEGDFEAALHLGEQSRQTDENLTMVRMYALSRLGQMGERLFYYPVKGNMSTIVPVEGSVQRFMLYPADSLYRHLGAKPRAGMGVKQYLRALVRSGKAGKAVADYVLCGCLLDRKIDAFARLLPYYYPIDSKLPRHYREALTLYAHLRSKPVVEYHDDVMDTDYADFKKLERKDTNPNARRLAVYKQYGKTYWWYYGYGER